MDLEHLKRWHWLLIGLLVGALWSSVRLFYGYNLDSDNPESGANFEYALVATPDALVHLGTDEGRIYLGDLRVYPAIKDDSPDILGTHQAAPPPRPAPRLWPWFSRPATNKAKPPAEPPPVSATTPEPKPAGSRQVNWVTGKVYSYRYMKDPKTGRTVPDPTPKALPFIYKASIPFIPDPRFDYVAHLSFYNLKLKPTAGYASATGREYPNILAYLDELNRKYGAGTVKYRYAWWESKAAVITLYPLAGMVVIGGIWPTVLGLLIGAGFGHKKGKGDEFDLSRFKGKSKASMPKAAVAMTRQDELRLAALEAEMEKNLQGFGANADVAATPAAVTPAPAVKPLAAVVEESKPAAEKPHAHKAFGASGGDYYPTEIHVGGEKK